MNCHIGNLLLLNKQFPQYTRGLITRVYLSDLPSLLINPHFLVFLHLDFFFAILVISNALL